MFEAYLTHEGILEPDDIPQTKEPIWILGKKYNGYQGKYPKKKTASNLCFPFFFAAAFNRRRACDKRGRQFEIVVFVSKRIRSDWRCGRAHIR